VVYIAGCGLVWVGWFCALLEGFFFFVPGREGMIFIRIPHVTRTLAVSFLFSGSSLLVFLYFTFSFTFLSCWGCLLS
jgi:hypothetical protein